MKVLNCPYCGKPPLMRRFPGRRNYASFEIFCPMYFCNMPARVYAPTAIIAINTWNDLVNKEKEKKK